MLMTTNKLILLRLFNMLIGRFDFGKKLLRKILEKKLIDNVRYQDRYVPCTKYFNNKYFQNGK
jgi:hypothetical protein